MRESSSKEELRDADIADPRLRGWKPVDWSPPDPSGLFEPEDEERIPEV